MKIKNYLLSVSVILGMLILSSCGKDGSTGPAGPSGPAGTTGSSGATGPTGPAGENGSVIYSGTATPSVSTGAAGDFYLDLTTGALYGPKTTTGWGVGFSLKGATGATGATGLTGAIGTNGAKGATGAAGNTIISGTGIPAATLGNTGDYYLDDSAYLLYGPKTATGWGTATALQGPPGTANVQYSGWNTTTDTKDTTIDGSAMESAILAAPALTNAVINSASIQVYFTYGAGVFDLPYTSDAGGKTSTIAFQPQVGQFVIYRYTYDDSGAEPLTEFLQYRYVIIPGSVLIGMTPNVNLKDYNAVKKYLRIKD